MLAGQTTADVATGPVEVATAVEVEDEDAAVEAAPDVPARVDEPAEEVAAEAAEDPAEEVEAVDDTAGPASLAPQIPLLVLPVPWAFFR